MANFNLVIDSKYDPFSFEEIFKNAAIATTAQKEAEEAYSTLSDYANEWGSYLTDKDINARKTYDKYINELNTNIDDLTANGLDNNLRRQLMALRARKASEIKPIETAVKRRRELSDEQRKSLQNNPTMLYQRMADDMSLDEFINNPEATYGQSYNGALITQQVSKIASNIAKEARNSEDGKGVLSKFGLAGQYEYIRNNGYSRDAVMKAILGSENADSILTGIVNDAISSTGIGFVDNNGNSIGEGWGDNNTRKRALDYARQGLWDAIGQSQAQIIKDEAYFANLARAHRLAEARTAAGERNPWGPQSPNLPLNIDELNLVNEGGKNNMKNINNALRYLKGGNGTKFAAFLSLKNKAGFYNPQYQWQQTKDPKNRVRLWNADGTLMTRTQFLKQADPVTTYINPYGNNRYITIDPKVYLSKVYDEAIKHMNTLEIDVEGMASRGKVPTVSYVQKQYDKLKKNSGYKTIPAIVIPLKNTKNVVRSLLSKHLSEDEDIINLKEIKSSTMGGDLIIKDSELARNDVFDEKSNNFKNTPIIHSSLVGKDLGIIITVNNRNFFIPAEKLGSLGIEAFANTPTINALYQKRKKLIDKYGEEVVDADPAGQYLKNTIEHLIAEHIRKLGQVIGGSYNPTSWNLGTTSENQQP